MADDELERGAGEEGLGVLPTEPGSDAETPGGRASDRAFEGSAAVNPERIGRFVIMDRLGSGGMGSVYSAYDPRLNRVVAVKLLHTATAGGHSQGRERLLREAQAMAQLAHPNVLPVFEVDDHEGDVFVAMELVKGGTLRAWLAEELRSWLDVLEVFEQAGRGLAAAHEAGLIHRDFKPDNVISGS